MFPLSAFVNSLAFLGGKENKIEPQRIILKGISSGKANTKFRKVEGY